MIDRPYNVLFLCTGNSARSIMGEAILNRLGDGRFRAYSAGSFPTGSVNPAALDLLHDLNYATNDLWSKSWDEFAKSGAPEFDFVITVCDNAAQEICPVWPGRPMTAHWSIFDPAAVKGSEAKINLAFRRAYEMLRQRISTFVSLSIDRLDREELQRRMNDLGRGAESEVQ